MFFFHHRHYYSFLVFCIFNLFLSFDSYWSWSDLWVLVTWQLFLAVVCAIWGECLLKRICMEIRCAVLSGNTCRGDARTIYDTRHSVIRDTRVGVWIKRWAHLSGRGAAWYQDNAPWLDRLCFCIILKIAITLLALLRSWPNLWMFLQKHICLQ